jgi:hypothetical protein
MSSLSLLVQLKSFREHRSLVDSIPIYCVFGDTVMRSIAQDRPTTMQALQGIRGLTPDKCHQYGQDILRLVQASPSSPPMMDPQPLLLKKLAELGKVLAGLSSETADRYLGEERGVLSVLDQASCAVVRGPQRGSRR